MPAGAANDVIVIVLGLAAYGLFAMMNYLIFVVVGGTRSYLGPLVGVVFLTVISEWLGFYEQLIPFKPIIYSLMLILVVMFIPGGLVSLPERVRASRTYP